MCDRQIVVRCVVDESDISKTLFYEVMSEDLGMKKACMRWVPKLLTQFQRANRVDCCEKLLKNFKQDPTGLFCRIVTGNEIWIHHDDPLSQQEAKTWKKFDEKIPTRPRVTRSADKIIMLIFWDCKDVLLVDLLPRSTTTINGPYCASLLHPLGSFIQEKHRCGVLLLHNNAPVYKFNIIQASPN